MLKRDPEAQDKLPEVMKQGVKDTPASSQKRPYSTSARRMAIETELTTFETPMPMSMRYPAAGFGHKFPLPDVKAIPRTDHLRRRYDPVVDQVTKSLMRDGKLSQAQKVCLTTDS